MSQTPVATTPRSHLSPSTHTEDGGEGDVGVGGEGGGELREQAATIARAHASTQDKVNHLNQHAHALLSLFPLNQDPLFLSLNITRHAIRNSVLHTQTPAQPGPFTYLLHNPI